MTVKGGVTDENKLSSANNIGVISDNNGAYECSLAKDIYWYQLHLQLWITPGHTTVTNGSGITIKNNGGWQRILNKLWF